MKSIRDDVGSRSSVASLRALVPDLRNLDGFATGVAPLGGIGGGHLAIDPDHHLWRNGRLWWVAFTILRDGWHQERIRLSLQTDDVEVARRRRDGLLALVASWDGCEISMRHRSRRPPAAAQQHPVLAVRASGLRDGSARRRGRRAHLDAPVAGAIALGSSDAVATATESAVLPTPALLEELS